MVWLGESEHEDGNQKEWYLWGSTSGFMLLAGLGDSAEGVPTHVRTIHAPRASKRQTPRFPIIFQINHALH